MTSGTTSLGAQKPIRNCWQGDRDGDRWWPWKRREYLIWERENVMSPDWGGCVSHQFGHDYHRPNVAYGYDKDVCVVLQTCPTPEYR